MSATDAVQLVNMNEHARFSTHERVNQQLMASNELVTRMNCYESGQITPMHTHPHEDEVLYVIEGRGSLKFRIVKTCPLRQAA